MTKEEKDKLKSNLRRVEMVDMIQKSQSKYGSVVKFFAKKRNAYQNGYDTKEEMWRAHKDKIKKYFEQIGFPLYQNNLLCAWDHIPGYGDWTCVFFYGESFNIVKGEVIDIGGDWVPKE